MAQEIFSIGIYNRKIFPGPQEQSLGVGIARGDDRVAVAHQRGRRERAAVHEDADKRRARAPRAELGREGELSRRQGDGLAVVALVLVRAVHVLTAIRVVVVLGVVREPEHKDRHGGHLGRGVRLRPQHEVGGWAGAVAARRVVGQRARRRHRAPIRAGQGCAERAGQPGEDGGVAAPAVGVLDVVPEEVVAVVRREAGQQHRARPARQRRKVKRQRGVGVQRLEPERLGARGGIPGGGGGGGGGGGIHLATAARCSEKGVRLAQNMQVGPCIPVGVQRQIRRKLAQHLGQLGIFLTCIPRTGTCWRAVLVEADRLLRGRARELGVRGRLQRVVAEPVVRDGRRRVEHA